MNEMIAQSIHRGQYNRSPLSYQIASTIPFGEYTVELYQMGVVMTNDQAPAFMMAFCPVNSDKLLAVLQPLKDAFQVHTANEFLRSMVSPDRVIEFITYNQYAVLVSDVFNDLLQQKFKLDYTQHRHGENISITPV